jgi:aminocarboxymuconate-semialdehyde decarboxylase
VTGPESTSIVDVHTHLFPRDLAKEFDTGSGTGLPGLELRPDGGGEIVLGGSTFRKVSASCWDPIRRLEHMDESGIDVQVISPVPITLVGTAPASVASAWSRRQNELLAAIVADHQGRFRALGMVPLQDVNAAVIELEYAVSVLGLPGVEIGTQVGGVELDDASLRPFFAAAEQLEVALFVHPTEGGTTIRRTGSPYEFGLGMLTDTALAAGALVFGGVLAEFPALRIALAHGCGTFAWALPRLVRGTGIGGPAVDAQHIDEVVSSLWVDALVFEPVHLPLLVKRFGGEHVMLGSDFPFYDRRWGAPSDVIAEAASTGLISAADAAGMYGPNARRFLATPEPRSHSKE